MYISKHIFIQIEASIRANRNKYSHKSNQVFVQTEAELKQAEASEYRDRSKLKNPEKNVKAFTRNQNKYHKTQNSKQLLTCMAHVVETSAGMFDGHRYYDAVCAQLRCWCLRLPLCCAHVIDQSNDYFNAVGFTPRYMDP